MTFFFLFLWHIKVTKKRRQASLWHKKKEEKMGFQPMNLSLAEIQYFVFLNNKNFYLFFSRIKGLNSYLIKRNDGEKY